MRKLFIILSAVLLSTSVFAEDHVMAATKGCRPRAPSPSSGRNDSCAARAKPACAVAFCDAAPAPAKAEARGLRSRQVKPSAAPLWARNADGAQSKNAQAAARILIVVFIACKDSHNLRINFCKKRKSPYLCSPPFPKGSRRDARVA